MKLSLSVKLSFTVVGLILVGGAATSYFVYTSSIQSLKDSISTSQAQLTSQSIDKIDRFMYERMVDVQELSSREQLQQYQSLPANRRTQSSPALVRQLNAYRAVGGAWENFLTIDTQGSATLSTSPAEQIKTLQQHPEYKAAYTQALAGKNSYTDLFAQTGARAPSTMLFMSPIRNTTAAGQPITGVVVGELTWQSALGILDNTPNSQAVLRNRQNLKIGQNNIKSTGKEYVTSSVKEKGYLDYKGNGWTLVLQAPTSQAFAPVARLTHQLNLIFLGVLLFSVCIILLVLNLQVKRPVSRLLEGVMRLAKGDFSQPVQLKTRDEFGDLAQAVNNMADKLQFAYNTLKVTTEITQKERSTLQTILDSLPVGVFVAKTPNGEPALINQAGIQLLGAGLKPLRHEHNTAEVYDIIREDGSLYPHDELPVTISLRTGKPAAKDDLLARKKDGSTRALRAISAPIIDANGNIDSAVGVYEDITDERVMERSKDEFFSIASHELRTPLTAMRGNTTMIKDYYWDELKSQDLKDMFSDIHESAIRLISVVNDFLDTSSLEQGRMKFTFVPVNIVEVAKAVIKDYQATGSHQHITLQIEEPQPALPSVFADYNRTKQVLINLVGNALKFTNKGTITISFGVEGNMVKTFVKDTGHGMTPEAQQRLFKKFEQSGNTVLTRDSVRGTGLGLYISKLIVESMHGHIQLESSQTDVGTTFSFTLMIESANNHPNAPQQ